jgi:hypothetical protein
LETDLPAPAPLEIETRTRCRPRFRRETFSVARFWTLTAVLRATRTQRPPFLRWTIIVTIASRVDLTVIVTARRFTLAESEATCAMGQPSFEIAGSFGHPSVASVRPSPSESAGGGEGHPFGSVP